MAPLLAAIHYCPCCLLKATEFVGNTSLFVCFLFVGVFLLMNTERQQNLLGHARESLAYVRERLTIVTTVKGGLAHPPKLMLTKRSWKWISDFKWKWISDWDDGRFGKPITELSSWALWVLLKAEYLLKVHTYIPCVWICVLTLPLFTLRSRPTWILCTHVLHVFSIVRMCCCRLFFVVLRALWCTSR